MAVSLDLDPSLRFAGSRVKGNVCINLNEARSDDIERVRITLRGGTHIVLRESSGYTTKSASASREYVRKDLELWRPGSSFPAQGDLLALPFDFELPGRLPPSNYTEHKIGKAYCRYQVDVISDRRGRLKQSRKVSQAFPVLPDDMRGYLFKQDLKHAGGQWSGPWKVKSMYARLRRAMWHAHAHVDVKLCLPDQASLPMATAIPFKLDITTRTRPLTSKELAKRTSEEHLFPYPPDLTAVQFDLKTRHQVRTGSSGIQTGWSHTQPLCQVEELDLMDQRREQRQTRPSPPGQSSRFEVVQSLSASGSLVLRTSSPAYISPFHSVSHEIILKVPFGRGGVSGLSGGGRGFSGCTVSLVWPLEITSGCAAVDAQHASDALPPAYFDV